jgi:hypothetical protein
MATLFYKRNPSVLVKRGEDRDYCRNIQGKKQKRHAKVKN